MCPLCRKHLVRLRREHSTNPTAQKHENASVLSVQLLFSLPQRPGSGGGLARRSEPLPCGPSSKVWGRKGRGCFHFIENRTSWIHICFLGRRKPLPLAPGQVRKSPSGGACHGSESLAEADKESWTLALSAVTTPEEGFCPGRVPPQALDSPHQELRAGSLGIEAQYENPWSLSSSLKLFHPWSRMNPCSVAFLSISNPELHNWTGKDCQNPLIQPLLLLIRQLRPEMGRDWLKDKQPSSAWLTPHVAS